MKGGIEELKNELSSKANTNNKNQGVQDINVTIGLENGILNLESIKNALKFAQAAMEGVDDLDVAESIEQINVKFNANGKSFEAKIGKGNNGEGINTSFMSYQPGDIDKMSLKDIQQLFSFTTDQPVKDIKRKGIKFVNEEIEKSFQHVVPQKEVINAERIQTKASGDIINEVDKPSNPSRNAPISVGVAKAEAPEMAPVATGAEANKANKANAENAGLNSINAEKINVSESANLTNKSTQQQDYNQIEILLSENLIQEESIESAVSEALRFIKNNKNVKSDKFKVKFHTFDEKQSFNVEFQFNNLKEIEDLLGTSNADAGITGEELLRLIQNTSFKALEPQPEGLRISKKVIIEQEGEVRVHSLEQQGKADFSKDSAVGAKFTPTKVDVEKFFEPPQTNPSLFNRIKSYGSEHPIKAAAIGVAAAVVGVGALAATVVTGGLFAVGAGLAGAAIGAGAYGIVKYNQYKDNENIIIGKPENFNHNNDPFKVKDAKIPEQSQATGIKANIEPSKNSTSIVEKLHLAPKTRPELKEPGTHVDQVEESKQTSGHSK